MRKGAAAGVARVADTGTPSQSPSGPWDVLPYLIPEEHGRDIRNGLRRSQWAPSANLAYGPYWRLPAGAYRLSFDCRTFGPRTERTVLGVEVVAGNRIHIAWRDFTAEELNAGAYVEFEVPPSLGAEQDGPAFEFLISQMGAGGLDLSAIALERIATARPELSRWRLMGPLRPYPFGQVGSDARPGPRVIRRRIFGAPSLRSLPLALPQGRFELRLRAEAKTSSPSKAMLAVRFRWRTREAYHHALTAQELAATPVKLEFVIGDGALAQLHVWKIEMRALAGRISLHDVELVRLGDAPASQPNRPIPTRKIPKRRLVAIGNCQVEMLALAMQATPQLAERFEARHYRPDVTGAMLEAARRDLASSDIVLMQDIADVEASPLKAEVPDGAQIVHAPCLHLASPWPFDGYNGPTDFAAAAQEGLELTFTSLDSLLGRLRDQIPDPEARFAAYAGLNVSGAPDVERLSRFETRRLLEMDRKYGFEIGAYIVESFPRKRLFHTTAHPARKLLDMLLRHVTGELGKPQGTRWRHFDKMQRDQTPIHPVLARRLGVRWADERTIYLHRGRPMTWEGYVRAYIAHYG